MSMSQYTGRKSLEAIAASTEGHGAGLTKTLGPFSLIGLGIGCIIGAGIFVLTGKAAASYAGPAISLSFVLSGIACGTGSPDGPQRSRAAFRGGSFLHRALYSQGLLIGLTWGKLSLV